ncbi:sulfate transporter family-domain-containing protein [Hyaloraphidium curvatum]|nr:sulfate transporter family-domain-containing protein [Hyaloraphidium curvatum]
MASGGAMRRSESGRGSLSSLPRSASTPRVADDALRSPVARASARSSHHVLPPARPAAGDAVRGPGDASEEGESSFAKIAISREQVRADTVKSFAREYGIGKAVAGIIHAEPEDYSGLVGAGVPAFSTATSAAAEDQPAPDALLAGDLPPVGRAGSSNLSLALKTAGAGTGRPPAVDTVRRPFRGYAKHKKLGSPPPEDDPEPDPEPAQPLPEPEIEIRKVPIVPQAVPVEVATADPEPEPYTPDVLSPTDLETEALEAADMLASKHQISFHHESGEQPNDFAPLLSYAYNSEFGMPTRTPTYQTFKHVGDAEESSRRSRWLGMFCPAGRGDGEPSPLGPPVWTWQTIKDELNFKGLVLSPASYLPAVFLGVLMNVLDALSYGLIIFPNEDTFPASAPSAGISIFFITTVVAQLTYSLGMSRFRGANGSMMIEVIPFLHAICGIVGGAVSGGDEVERKKAVLATVMVCYVLSTLATGAAFFLLGFLKLGNVMSFFPRHLLIATIGGIGMFLVLTGVEVTAEVPFTLGFSYLRDIFQPAKLMLWGTSAAIAVVLQVLSHRIRHPLFVPCFFMLVPAIFYIVVFSARIPFDELRRNGWLFDLAQPGSEQSSPFEFYSYFSLSLTRWDAVLACVPTILAVAFFGVLHVPINIPALSVSTGTEVDTNGELIAHGVSNLVAGMFGTVQNYLVYSNSLLFIRSGGDSRVAGTMLAAATGVCFFVGTWLVDYVPVIVVGALIFHLGFDLVRESLVDTFPILSRLEYLTVVLVALSMPVWGFTEGIILGIMAASLFFVIQTSRRSIVRGQYTGRHMWSPVHRLYRQQRFLERVGEQIRVYRLQGQVFFGTVNQLESIVKEVQQDRVLRCLVMDFALTTALDYTAAEAFTKLRRALARKQAILCLAGISSDSSILQALDRVGMLEEDVRIFDTLDSALEFCENLLLESFFRHQARVKARQEAPRQVPSQPAAPGAEILGSTVRSGQLSQAVEQALLGLTFPTGSAPEPYNLLCSVLAEAADGDNARLEQVVEAVYRSFRRMEMPAGSILWGANGDADGLYVVERGQLSLVGQSEMGSATAEILLAGTMVGQIELVASRPRLATLVVDEEAVLWHLGKRDLEELMRDRPGDALTFVRYSLCFVHQLLNETINHRVRYE